MNLQNMDYKDVLKQLMKFDTSKLTEVVMSQSFWSMQRMLPKNITDRVTVVVKKLEQDTSITSELQQVVSCQFVY